MTAVVSLLNVAKSYASRELHLDKGRLTGDAVRRAA